MISRLILTVSLCCLFPAGLFAWEARIPAQRANVPQEIFQYVERPEPDFHWSLEQTIELKEGKIFRLHLVSQKWQGIVWQHPLIVYEPNNLSHKEHVLLFVTGGSNGKIPGEKDLGLGLNIAQACGARIATLHQVPNQPLLGDHVEDDLITETWLKYLETGDPTWPLLFPMVKSAVKAMDAIEQFSQKQFQQPVEGFVISGASKRGWTSWLTPVADQRVIATAPMVIDVLNFPEQMKHQKETWGVYSEQIHDYTSKGLVRENGIPEEGREADLWKMMDPYTYRQMLPLPKLLIVGANDPYWTVDAMNIYWDDLAGPKYTIRLPNAGHGLDQGRELALQTLGVFFRCSVTGKELPKLTWKSDRSEKQISLSMTTDQAPKVTRLWYATSHSQDFRKSEWQAKTLAGENGQFAGSASAADGQHLAVFGEVHFEFEKLPYSLSTLVYWK